MSWKACIINAFLFKRLNDWLCKFPEMPGVASFHLIWGKWVEYKQWDGIDKSQKSLSWFHHFPLTPLPLHMCWFLLPGMSFPSLTRLCLSFLKPCVIFPGKTSPILLLATSCFPFLLLIGRFKPLGIQLWEPSLHCDCKVCACIHFLLNWAPWVWFWAPKVVYLCTVRAWHTAWHRAQVSKRA